MNEYDTLYTELARVFGPRKAASQPSSSFGLAAGLETLSPGTNYSWDGEMRGGDPAYPYLIFQVTLAGWGTYDTEKVTPGKAFAAVVPSRHRYELPSSSSGWTYFWLILRHPYVVERVKNRQKSVGAVLDVASPSAGPVTRCAQIVSVLCSGGYRDTWAEEAALLDWLCEYERFCELALYPAAPRERLLSDVRAAVLSCLQTPPDVSALARERGQSRSAFAHAFKAATGLAPAAYVTRVRLEEAVQRLLSTAETLEMIAVQTGFADANHFCKVFRRHFYLSPGAYRRQMK